MSFFEDFLDKNIDFNDEVSNIYYLLKRDTIRSYSIYSTISKNFLNWKLRNNCVTLDNFFDSSGIKRIIDCSRNGEKLELYDYLSFVEVVWALIQFVYPKLEEKNLVLPITENIMNTLSKINYEIIHSKKNGVEFPKCVEKDFKVSEVVDIVDDKNLAEKILMYKHRDNIGNLYEKAIILSRLYMYFEDIRKTLEGNGHKSMCDLIGFLSDKLKVRHKPTSKDSLIINDYNKKDLEILYDKLFDSYLSAIVIENYLSNDKTVLQAAKNKFDNK